jgi:hypothetical protein
MSASEIAKTAYAQAVALAEAEEARKQAEREEEERRNREKEERRNREIHQKRFEAALVPLNVWFPGVKWEYEIGGDFFCNDTIIFEQDEYPPPFKLKALGPVNPGKHMEFEVGDYLQDSSMPGYTYWSGTKVKSAADLGRYLVNRCRVNRLRSSRATF